MGKEHILITMEINMLAVIKKVCEMVTEYILLQMEISVLANG